jgi:choline dehydrogenase-like flavoprotein
LNLDPNDGDPIGFGLALHSTKNGLRITSESAFLRQGLPNLRIHQGTVVSKIIFENKKAVGVQCNGIQCKSLCIGRVIIEEITETVIDLASKEVILSAGAIGSPQLLLHSGVGSSSELQPLGIEVVQDLPGIGKSFSDHPSLPMVYHMGHNFSERVIFSSDPAKVSAAEESLKKSMAGPLTQYMSSGVMAFLQLSDLKDLEEFSQLSPESRELLLKQTTPHFELAIVSLFLCLILVCCF